MTQQRKLAPVTSNLLSLKGSANSDEPNGEHQHHDETPSKVAKLLSKIRIVGNKHHDDMGHEAALESKSSAKTAVVAVDDETVARLQRENEKLRRRMKDLEEENQMLHYEVASRIVLETFEGEGKMRKLAKRQQLGSLLDDDDDDDSGEPSLTWTGEEIVSEYDQQVQNEQWCDDTLEDGSCPVEPMVSFGEALRDRAYWLVGLLVLQSCSGIILARNEALLANHPVSK